MRGPRVPCGLLPLPRVTPHWGCASAERAWTPLEGGRQHAALLRRAVRRPPAWPWPPGKRCRRGPWRRRPAWQGCRGPGAGAPVCRGGPGPARGWPGALAGALPGAVGGVACLGRETGAPRRLRPGHAAHGAARLTPRPPGICRGGAPQSMQAWSGGCEAWQGAQLRPGRHGHGALAPPPGLEGVAPWRDAPGVALRVEGACQTPSTGTLGSDGRDVCLQDARRGRGGTAPIGARIRGKALQSVAYCMVL